MISSTRFNFCWDKVAQVSLPGNRSLHQQHHPKGDGKHAGMSCHPPGSFSHSLLLSQNTPCNRTLIVVAPTQSVQMLTRCCQSGNEVEKGASAVTNMTGLDQLLVQSAEHHCASWQQCWLTKAYPPQADTHNDLKKALWNVASSFYHFSGSGNASNNLSCCVHQEMPSLSQPGVPRLGAQDTQTAPERLCSV